MLSNLKHLGTVLSTEQQQSISGGQVGTYYWEVCGRPEGIAWSTGGMVYNPQTGDYDFVYCDI